MKNASRAIAPIFAILVLACQSKAKGENSGSESKAESTPCSTDDEIPPVEFPKLKQTGKLPQDFIPKGWKLECEAQGDISRDSISDLVLVFRQVSAKNLCIGTGGPGEDTLNTNPRILAIALGLPNQQGFKLVAENHDLIPRHEERTMSDAFDKCPSIQKGSFSIALGLFSNAGSWFMSNSTFTFRYENSMVRLIGFDYNSTVRNTGEFHSKSLNYLSGKGKFEDGNIENEESKPYWKKLTGPKLISLDQIGNGNEFENESQ